MTEDTNIEELAEELTNEYLEVFSAESSDREQIKHFMLECLKIAGNMDLEVEFYEEHENFE